jgi:hypothetical protein
MYSVHTIHELVARKPDKKLKFIHTPKCGGSYVDTILSHLGLEHPCGHIPCDPCAPEITFTVVRHPVDRFESLLNYRLNKKPRSDFPSHLYNVYRNPDVSLNAIVSRMTDAEILGFRPYSTLTYWTKHVDILLTLDKLSILLEYFGYTYDPAIFPKVNVSSKTRGKLNQQNRRRIKALYKNDVKIYNTVIHASLF